VHADRPDVAESPELLEFPGEEGDRLLVVALRLRQHLVVVADLVAEGEDLLDDLRDERVRVPEVVGRGDPEGVLEFGHLQGVLRLSVDIVAEDDRSPTGAAGKVPVDRDRRIPGAEEHTAELSVLCHRKVPHHQLLTAAFACISNSIAKNRNCIPIMKTRSDSTPCTKSTGYPITNFSQSAISPPIIPIGVSTAPAA